MKRNMILGTLLAATTLQAATPAYANETVGNIIGGIIGGVISSNIGKGNGNKAAIIAGTIIGSLIGQQVGADLEDGDRRAIGDAQRNCMNGATGSRQDWDGARYGSRTGARGSFSTVREGYNMRTGESCREYMSVIEARGRREENRGIACSRTDGSFYEANQTEISYDGRRPGGGHGGGRPGGPGRPGPIRPGPRPYPDYPNNPPPPPPPPSYGQEASLIANGVTRRTGGEWLRINIRSPIPMQGVSVQVLRAGVKLHEAVLVTDYNQRLPIYELTNTPVLYAGAQVTGYVNRNERIVAVDIRAESFGDYSDLRLSIVSREGRPVIDLQRF